jgi:hypothetical protein
MRRLATDKINTKKISWPNSGMTEVPINFNSLASLGIKQFNIMVLLVLV